MQPYGPSNTKNVSTVLAPGQALYIDLYNGHKKWFKMRWDKHFILAILGGYWVGIFSHCATTIHTILTENGANPGWSLFVFGLIFSTALTSIVLTGADLLTSNMFYSSLMSIDMIGPKGMKVDVGGFMSCLRLIKYIGTSFIGNFIGAGVIGVGLSYMTNIDIQTGICYMSKKKTSLSALEILSRGIVANTCIIIATHAINIANSVEGKVAAMLMPVLAFCIGGGEHVVANMFLVTGGYTHGCEKVTALKCLKNLSFAFWGNFIAAFFVALMLSYGINPDGKVGEKYELGGEEYPIHTVRTFNDKVAKDLFLAQSEETDLPDDNTISPISNKVLEQK